MFHTVVHFLCLGAAVVTGFWFAIVGFLATVSLVTFRQAPAAQDCLYIAGSGVLFLVCLIGLRWTTGRIPQEAQLLPADEEAYESFRCAVCGGRTLARLGCQDRWLPVAACSICGTVYAVSARLWGALPAADTVAVVSDLSEAPCVSEPGSQSSGTKAAAAFIAATALLFASAWVLLVSVRTYLGVLLMVAGAALFAVTALGIAASWGRSASRPLLRCPVCDYDLRGCAEPRCPECGTRFDVGSVRDSDPEQPSAVPETASHASRIEDRGS